PAPSSPKVPPSSPQEEPSPVPEPVADAEPRFSLIRELAVITQLHAHPAPLSALYLKSDSTLLYSADIKGTVVRHERNFVSPRDSDFPTTTP
ncbi:MAG: hypothetical protein Q8P67_18690, partial [archaeon]|nr:hypothetical protein [archaeon]